MVPRLTPESLEYSLNRTKQFWLAHRGDTFEERTEAATVLLSHLGLDDANKKLLGEIIDSLGLAPAGHGPAYLGALVILYAYDYFNDIES